MRPLKQGRGVRKPDSDRTRGVLLYRKVQRFQGGLVFQAHSLWYHSTLGLRVIKEEKKVLHAELSPSLCLSLSLFFSISLSRSLSLSLSLSVAVSFALSPCFCFLHSLSLSFWPRKSKRQTLTIKYQRCIICAWPTDAKTASKPCSRRRL